jgi:hypothetical protein
MDCIATEDGEDFSWDAIWDSEVTILILVGCRNENSVCRFAILKITKSNLGCKFHEKSKEMFKIHLNYVDNKIGL